MGLAALTLLAPIGDTLRNRPLLAFPALFAAGLLGGAGAAGRPARSRYVMIALYVAGLALVYAILGLLAGLTGSIFGAVSANKWALLVMANLLLIAGLAMLAIPVVQWLTTDMLSMRLFVVGGLGVALFFWGLLSIGDKKNEWE